MKPVLDRFNAEPTAYDLAFSTCVTLDNMGDHLYAVQKGVRPKEARNLIAAKYPQFQRVVVIANAFKHVELANKDHGIYVGTRAEHAVIDEGAAFSDGSYYSDGTSHDDAGQTVVMTFPNGERSAILITYVTRSPTTFGRSSPSIHRFAAQKDSR